MISSAARELLDNITVHLVMDTRLDMVAPLGTDILDMAALVTEILVTDTLVVMAAPLDMAARQVTGILGTATLLEGMRLATTATIRVL